MTREFKEGQRFRNWTFLHGIDKKWAFCRCECGNEVPVQYNVLIYFKTEKCNKCVKRNPPRSKPKNGQPIESHPLYAMWLMMRRRCQLKSLPSYKSYGGRGITVCERWDIVDYKSTGFMNFVHDMGPRPDGYSIERNDNNGNYEPGNCRWASRLEQARNKRNIKLYSHEGFTATLPEVCEKFGFPYKKMLGRMFSGKKLSFEDAIAIPF